MRTNRTPDEWDKWRRAIARITEELRKYYRACAAKALPPRLLALTKKFDEERPTDQPPMVRDIEI
jgi:hypothetical protein